MPSLSFLHRPRFLQSLAQGKQNANLVFALCGLAVSCISGEDTINKAQAARWIEEAENQVLRNLDNPSVGDVAALVVLAFNHTVCRRFSRLMVIMGAAARLAYLLRLNIEAVNAPFPIREQRRRLMWGIWFLDVCGAQGQSNFSGCSRESINLQLPCDDHFFNFDVPVTTQGFPERGESYRSPNLGLLAYLVLVAELRHRVDR